MIEFDIIRLRSCMGNVTNNHKFGWVLIQSPSTQKCHKQRQKSHRQR